MPVSPQTTRWIRRCTLAATMVVAAVPAAAQSSIANFNSLTDGGLGVRLVANCYVEANLRFTVVGDPCGTSDSFATWGPTQSAYYSGSPALFNNSATGTAVDITAASGERGRCQDSHEGRIERLHGVPPVHRAGTRSRLAPLLG